MRILLYNPDNGVTQNFMPHLWMFLLQALTPSGHEVVLIDGNTQPMSDDALALGEADETWPRIRPRLSVWLRILHSYRIHGESAWRSRSAPPATGTATALHMGSNSCR
jgi:hypothetical protein